MSVDITEPKMIANLFLVAVIVGVVLGFACNLLFYTVTHIEVIPGSGRYILGTGIPPFWGSVFIIIMALTGFAIAVTFRFVPGWVADYYQYREVPPVFLKAWDWVKTINKKLMEFDEGE